MKQKLFSLLFSCFLAITMTVSLLPDSVSAATENSQITYTESVNTLKNPERGFYDSCYIDGKETGTEVKSPKGNIIHLRISLGEFSHEFLKHQGDQPANYTVGGWNALSKDFLTSLNQTMNNIRQNGSTAIIRFAYDNFDGIPDMEPSIDGILNHIQQLKSFFTENEDVILAVESGFVGSYGEQHSSQILTPSYSETTKNTIYTLVNALLDVIPSSISVTVRRPTYAAYACGMTMDELKNTDFSETDKYYRVGVYNDGMFGSQSDLGTFRNRSEEIAWLNRQALHTAYGGETNRNRSTDGTDYTNGNYVCQEMFQTHVTYLNDSWPDETINGWKNTLYNGSDTIYTGQSTYTFFENHMGYRYVLRDFTSKNNAVHFQIENVGAGNMLKAKNTSLVLVDETGEISEISTNIDVRNWDSQTISEETASLNAKPGTYQVYLKISDTNGNLIQLANDNPFTQNGNLIGTVTILDSSSNPEPDEPPTEQLPEYDTDGSFLIRNEEDLLAFAEMTTENKSIDGRLTKDIYLSQIWTPIEYYAGNFDGDNHTIYNLKINGEGIENQGFIGKLEANGHISNLHLKSGFINGTARVGGIVGYAKEHSLIENCSSDLTVSGQYRVAGIVGYSMGIVRNCVNYGKIDAPDTAAGIAAYLKTGNVANCYNYGTITGNDNVGGIIGYSNESLVSNCINNGTVNGYYRGGGIVGYLYSGRVEDCKNTAEIICDQNAGGAVGYSYKAEVSDCVNSGNISGTYRTGGVIGYLKVSSLKNGRNTGIVSGVKYFGDILGYNNDGTFT